jgi:Flp pilus assembly protein TadD
MAAALLLPHIAGAQSSVASSPLKAPNEPPPRPLCSAVKPTTAPTDEQRRQARDLAQRGEQAGILGDSPGALKALRDASALDPTDPDLAYHLARAYETAKDAPSAAREYCRFLALSPTAQEADEIIEKVRILAPPPVDTTRASALAAFRSGMTAFEHGRLATADTAFTRAIRFDSTWAEAYYNLGFVRQMRGDRASARADFAQYLRFNPAATDRGAVAARISSLATPTLSSAQAFMLGVVLPGAGEFYTRRPIRGVLTLAAVGGAVAYGLQQKNTSKSIQSTGTDPFGNPYTYTTTSVTAERPNLVIGAIAAGAVAAVSAVDAAIFAHFSGAEAARVGVTFLPGSATAVAKVSLFIR